MSDSSPSQSLSRRSILKAALAASATLTATGLLAACGAAVPSPAQPAAQATTAPAATSAPAAAVATKPAVATSAPTAAASTKPAPAAAATKGGKTLTVAVESDASSLKPDTWGPTLNWYAARSLYDTLIHYGTKAGPDGLLYYDDEHLDMRLAEKVDLSPDRKTITWTIRNGATFEGGKKIDADAIVKSFQWYLDRNQVGGGQAKVDGLTSRDSVVAKDNTVIMTLKDTVPWGIIANYISLLAIVDADEIMKHATPEDKFGEKWLERNATPSGAYKVEKWTSGEQMVLVARDNFYAGKPPIERLVFRIIPDASVRFSLMKKGDVDMASNLDYKDLSALKAEPTVAIEPYIGNSWGSLGLNWKEPQFQDKNVRKAIASAIPYDEIINTVYYGFAVQAKTPFGQKVAGADPTTWPYSFDLEQAKKYLAQSAFPTGFPMTFTIVNDDVNVDKESQLIAESLGKIGIKVTIQKSTSAQVSDALVAKKLSMAITDFTSFVPDAGYHVLWNHLPDSYANFFGYANPEQEKLGRELLYMDPKEPKRLDLLKKYQELMAQDVFAVYLHSFKTVIPHKKSVKGFAYFPDMPLGVRFDKLSIE